jgi:hypothetical protein
MNIMECCYYGAMDRQPMPEWVLTALAGVVVLIAGQLLADWAEQEAIRGDVERLQTDMNQTQQTIIRIYELIPNLKR